MTKVTVLFFNRQTEDRACSTRQMMQRQRQATLLTTPSALLDALSHAVDLYFLVASTIADKEVEK